MCGSKGTSTTSSTYSPPANVQANYDYLANQAKSVAATPFQQYQGEMVSGLTPTQEAGIQNVNASAGLAQPYYGAGAGYVQQAATPFGQQQLNQYMSPYINDVVSQTMANLNETNAQQQQGLLGNAIQRGAFGGDRAGVAQAELARQQNLATGQTLANVLQGGYGQALGQFNADQNRQLQTGSTLGQLGTGAQGAALQGAQAQLSAGAQQQAVQQAQDVANQQQFQAAQAYPFQTTQYLGNLLLGIGGQSGGTALTAQPQGNVGTSLLGGLLTAGQMFRPFKDGGSVDEDNSMGGAVHEGLGRAAYALDGGVDYIPYAEQPSGGSTKPLSLADVMQVPTKVLRPVGGKANIPQAPEPAKEGETMMDIAKQLANASPESKANLKANVAALRSNLGLGTVAPADVIGTPGQRVGDIGGLYSAPIGPMQEYAAGGVVNRHGYANDGAVQSNSTDDQQPAQGRTLAEAIAGHPLSEEANMGLLAAGLGMLSNKSPIFGIGVGEGATAGLGTYYNAIANKRAYEKQQQELQMTEEQRDIDRQRLAEEKRYHDIESGLRGQEYGWKAYEYLQSGMKYGTLSTGEKGYVDSRNGVEIPENQFGEYIQGQMAKMPFGANILGGKTAIGPTTSTGVSPAPSANAKLESTTKAGVVPATASTDQPPAPDETKSIVDAAKAVLNPPVDTSKAAVVPAETVLNPPKPAQNATLPFKVGAYGVPELSAEDHYNPDILTKAASYLREKYADLRDPQHEAQTRQALEWEKEARDLQNRKIATSSGTEYIATPGVVRPLSVGPKPIGPDDPKSYVNPDTGAVVQVPVDVGYKTTKGWKPDPEVPSNAVLQSGDKFQDTQKTKSAELESELMKGAPTLNNAITAIINYSAAAKSSEFGPTTTDKAKVAGVLKGLHLDSLADGVLDGTKTLANVADALKSTVDQAQTSAQAAFPRVTQNEFAIQKEEGTPNIDIDPNAAQRLSAVRLAPLLYTNAIISAWQKEKQTNNTENFESYLATWKKAHPYSLFQDSARKLLGNFRGTDLPKNADIIDNGLYVMPNAPSKTNSNLYKAAAAEHIRAGQTFKVSGVKHQGKEGWSYDAITPSDANSTFDAMTHYPAFQYGVQ